MSDIINKETKKHGKKIENENIIGDSKDSSVSYSQLVCDIIPSIKSASDAIVHACLESIKNLNDYFQSETWKIFADSISEIIKSFGESSISISSSLRKSLKPLLALNVLRKSKWPYFMYLNENNYDCFIECKECSNHQEELEHNVAKIIFSECDDNFVNGILKQWCDKEYVSLERELLFSQALQCYKNELYAASTTLLLTQVGWIINETSEYLKSNKIIANKKEYDDFIEYTKIQTKKGTEKDNLVNILSTLDVGHYRMSLCVEYITTIIYASSEDFCGNQPCRNKIMHGIQSDFNTKEHALKTILIFDSLIKMRDYVESLSNNRL